MEITGEAKAVEHQPDVHPFDTVLGYLRAYAYEVIPSPIVCGMAGISEGAFRARLNKGNLRPSYIYFGLRTIQVVPVEQVEAEFFPDGFDSEALEELAFGRTNDSFIPMKAHFLRVLFAGFTDMGAVKRAVMAETYKRGKNRNQDRE